MELCKGCGNEHSGKCRKSFNDLKKEELEKGMIGDAAKKVAGAATAASMAVGAAAAGHVGANAMKQNYKAYSEQSLASKPAAKAPASKPAIKKSEVQMLPGMSLNDLRKMEAAQGESLEKGALKNALVGAVTAASLATGAGAVGATAAKATEQTSDIVAAAKKKVGKPATTPKAPAIKKSEVPAELSQEELKKHEEVLVKAESDALELAKSAKEALEAVRALIKK